VHVRFARAPGRVSTGPHVLVASVASEVAYAALEGDQVEPRAWLPCVPDRRHRDVRDVAEHLQVLD